MIIRWHLQHEVVVIPKSVNATASGPTRTSAGSTLSDDDMATLDGLGGR